MSVRTIHVDLNFGRTNFRVEEPLFLKIRSSLIPLQQHNDLTLDIARKKNKGLELILRSKFDAMSHFAEVSDDLLSDDRVHYIKVVGEKKEASHLPNMYMQAYYCSKKHIVRHYKKKFKKAYKTSRPNLSRNDSHSSLIGLTAFNHAKLGHYGTEPYDEIIDSLVQKIGQKRARKQLMDITTGLNDTLSPVDIAVSMLFQHPEVSTNKPAMATVVQQDCILQTTNPNQNQYNAVTSLATQIAGLGPDGWSSTSVAKDQNGNVVTAEYTLKSGNDVTIFEQGSTLSQYNYDPSLDPFIKPPLSYTTLAVRNTPVLQNSQWSVNHGVPSINTEVSNNGAAPEALVATSDASGGWTVVDKSPGHGISVNPSTLKFTPGTLNPDKWGTLKIDAKNGYLRSLGVSVEFYDSTEMTTPIKNPTQGSIDWPSYYEVVLGLLGPIADLFETDTIKGIGSLGAVNSVMGIPLPTAATTLSMNWPNEAQAAKLYFGSLGTSNWTPTSIIWPGVINTGIFQYGIPVFFLAAGAAIADTEFYEDLIKDGLGPVLDIAAPVVQNIIETGGNITAESILLKFADVVVSMLVKDAFKDLATAIALQITAAEAEDSIPVLGEVIRIANMAIDTASILVTTGEILASPALVESSVKRQMTLNFTLHPDPAHGEPGNPSSAIWPLVADHVVTTVVYTNGTNYQITQNLPPTSSNTPLLFTYADIGWGGQYKITANVYSSNGWLCGQYKSGLIDAQPDNQSSAPYIQTKSDNITEFLVPLTQDTQYLYKQKLAYEDGKHTWIVGDVPTATIADLSKVNGGDNLAQLVDITINEKAYQAGYHYRAANQYIPLTDINSDPTADQMFVFQNISVLSEDTLNERLKYSSVGFENQGYILYDTFGKGPDKDTISPYNFIVDSRYPCADSSNSDGTPPACYFLRRVDLMDGKHDFGLGVSQNESMSYGMFSIPDLDAIVFHESGYVIGASFNYSKVQILKLDLSKGPVPDKEAPVAGTLSGPGINQGLTLGPVAMKVTPDGRILILETLNRRIQAFDVFGNPVPSFTGNLIFKINSVSSGSSYIQDLDNGLFSDDLKNLFIQNGLAYLSDIEEGTTYVADLNSTTLTLQLIDAFQNFGIFLTYNKNSDGSINPDGSTFITVTTAGQSWTVTDPNKDFNYLLEYDQTNDVIVVKDALDKVTITVKGKGLKWVVTDLIAVESYILEYDSVSSEISTSRYVSYFWLGAITAPKTAKPAWLQAILDNRFTYALGEFIWNNIPADVISQGWNAVEPVISQALYPPFDVTKIEIIKDVTYLDVAVESKGYMYILYYRGDGTQNTDYFIDIYDPTGEFVVTTPDPSLYKNPDSMQYVAAARLTLDIWRNIFSLNFEKFQGPSMQTNAPGRTEPSISTWVPTPPDFTLPMTDLTAFQDNTSQSGPQAVSSTVKGFFSDHSISLSSKANITRVAPADTSGQYSHFQITDGDNSYDIIVSISYGGKTPASNAAPTQMIYVYNILA